MTVILLLFARKSRLETETEFVAHDNTHIWILNRAFHKVTLPYTRPALIYPYPFSRLRSKTRVYAVIPHTKTRHRRDPSIAKRVRRNRRAHRCFFKYVFKYTSAASRTGRWYTRCRPAAVEESTWSRRAPSWTERLWGWTISGAPSRARAEGGSPNSLNPSERRSEASEKSRRIAPVNPIPHAYIVVSSHKIQWYFAKFRHTIIVSRRSPPRPDFRVWLFFSSPYLKNELFHKRKYPTQHEPFHLGTVIPYLVLYTRHT